jgi:hypothetical protein
MKTVASLLIGIAFVFGQSGQAAAPRGNVMELHSCELYAGGCIVSSESTIGGRYMLRAWNFTGGSFAGTDLMGLKLALLQASGENLAAPKAEPGQAMVYLPESASPQQREALLAWLRATQPGLKAESMQTRTVSLEFANEKTGYAFKAGNFVSVKTASLESCDASCGESLWYTPRTPTTVFTVAVDQASRVEEPRLQVKWVDASKRSIFLGRFEGDCPAKEIYVTATDLCGPADKLF